MPSASGAWPAVHLSSAPAVAKSPVLQGWGLARARQDDLLLRTASFRRILCGGAPFEASGRGCSPQAMPPQQGDPLEASILVQNKKNLQKRPSNR